MRTSFLGLAFTLLSSAAPALAGASDPPALTPAPVVAPVPAPAAALAPAPVVAPAPRRLRPPYAAGPSAVTPGVHAGSSAALGAPRPSDFRLGVDGSAGLGPIAYTALSLRLESEVKPHGNAMLRLGYMRGRSIGDEGDGFDGIIAALGYRSYSVDGNWYGSLAAGVLAGRRRRYLYEGDDPQGAKWGVLPDVSAGGGIKLGPIDLGIGVSIPVMAVSLTLGLEISNRELASSSSSPNRPGVPRRRVQYRSR